MARQVCIRERGGGAFVTASSRDCSVCKHLSQHVIYLWGANFWGSPGTFCPPDPPVMHPGHPHPAPLSGISTPLKPIPRDRCPLLCPSPALQIPASAQAALANPWSAESVTSTAPRAAIITILAPHFTQEHSLLCTGRSGSPHQLSPPVPQQSRGSSS